MEGGAHALLDAREAPLRQHRDRSTSTRSQEEGRSRNSYCRGLKNYRYCFEVNDTIAVLSHGTMILVSIEAFTVLKLLSGPA